MGIDVVVYATGDLTVDSHSRFFMLDYEHIGDRVYLRDAKLDRYYGPVYPRGDWPAYYTLIRMFKALLPKATVWYTDDHSISYNEDAGDECTEEYMQKLWEFWLSENGQE